MGKQGEFPLQGQTAPTTLHTLRGRSERSLYRPLLPCHPSSRCHPAGTLPLGNKKEGEHEPLGFASWPVSHHRDGGADALETSTRTHTKVTVLEYLPLLLHLDPTSCSSKALLLARPSRAQRCRAGCDSNHTNPPLSWSNCCPVQTGTKVQGASSFWKEIPSSLEWWERSRCFSAGRGWMDRNHPPSHCSCCQGSISC